MAATLAIEELNGAGPTATTITALKHQTADRYNNDATYPIQIPASGTQYGFGKTLRLLASGTFTSLTNFKFYMDGANGFGAGVTLGAKALASGGYAQATGTTGQTGNLISGMTDAFTYTSASPLSLTGSFSAAGNGTSMQLLNLQMAVASTAAQGTTGSENLTWRWDEV